MNRIEIDLDDSEFLVQVEFTSLQMMRQPIVLHAKGLFAIDYSAMIRVRSFVSMTPHSCSVIFHFQLLGGITTYMVFYIQLAQKFEEDDDD